MLKNQIPRILEDFEKSYIDSIISSIYEEVVRRCSGTALGDWLEAVDEEVQVAAVIDNSEVEYTLLQSDISNDLDRILASCTEQTEVKFFRQQKLTARAVSRGLSSIRNSIETQYACEMHVYTQTHHSLGPCFKVELIHSKTQRSFCLFIPIS